jgi:hypothetical protein
VVNVVDVEGVVVDVDGAKDVPDVGALVEALMDLVDEEGGVRRGLAALDRQEVDAVVHRLVLERVMAGAMVELRRAP